MTSSESCVAIRDATMTSSPWRVKSTKGRRFDQKAYREPDLIEYARTRKSGGFGVHIMRKLMDDVAWRTAGGYNECCMTKHRH